jgi:hypothetical protein
LVGVGGVVVVWVVGGLVVVLVLSLLVIVAVVVPVCVGWGDWVVCCAVIFVVVVCRCRRVFFFELRLRGVE